MNYKVGHLYLITNELKRKKWIFNVEINRFIFSKHFINLTNIYLFINVKGEFLNNTLQC